MTCGNRHTGLRVLSLILAITLLVSMLSGCDISSKHLEMEYEENTNENISDWDDAEDDNVNDWDSANVVTTWDDVDDYSDWVYAEIVFDDITDEYPIIECQVLDYKSNGQYFDGDKIYSMVGDKFDANSFVAKYAIGTGVIVICVVLTVVTAGTSTPFACFIAGAADGAVSYAIKGAAFGAAMQAVSTAISTGGDLEEVVYGTLEGSADGYMWGAMYGAITGGFSSTYCFTEDTPVLTLDGTVAIQDISVGTQILAYSEEENTYAYKPVTQVLQNETSETVRITVGDDEIESTPNHPYWTGDAWVPAEDLDIGDVVYSTDGTPVVVNAVESIHYDEPINTYNLCVDEFHSFLVGNEGIIVHNRCNINGDYAGKTKYLDDPELAAKYPDGVPFTQEGFPDFSAYAEKTVKFEMPSQSALNADTCLTGNYNHDFAMANKACGFSETPSGYTWHHNQDMMTMELIPTDLHQAIRHTGGASLIKDLLRSLL